MKSTSGLTGAIVVILVVLAAPSGHAHHAQYYVLDGFGGIHAGGGAPVPPGGIPYFGFDIARDIAYLPGLNADALLVLDGFGGVHAAGGGAFPPTPYFGFDIARAIVYRSILPRATGSATANVIELINTSTSFTVLRSVMINAPDDGFLFVSGSSYVGCNGAEVVTLLAINVDATTQPSQIAFMGQASFNCANVAGFQNSNNQTLTHLFPVAAGPHTVNLLGRKKGGSGSASILGRSLTAIFIDHGASGSSLPEPGAGADPTTVR